MNWLNQRIVILGMARQGMALARYLAANGARVTLSDMKPASGLAAEITALTDTQGAITFALGGHPLTLLDACDMLCLSGGVPIDMPIVIEAQRRRMPISNDSQIFFEACPAPILGITGSAGKTTTTTLVSEMLQAEFEGVSHAKQHGAVSIRVWTGGNIGNPLIADLGSISQSDRVVMELSSFQLEQMTCSPHIACITNITPNHLDRHGTMEAYITAKTHILEYQTADDWAVLYADNPVTATLTTTARTVYFTLGDQPDADGAWRDANGDLRVRIRALDVDVVVCNVADLLLMGDHNVLNVLAASMLSAIAGTSVESMRAVATTFRGVAHRLQLVRELRGVRYYDDSIATAPERLMAALRCFKRPVVLLCGGRDKHLPWADAVELMARSCRHVVLFGEMAGLVNAEIGRQRAEVRVTICGGLDEAVMVASRVVEPGDVVLLSPGGTSFDGYRDFAERGTVFVQLVNQIGE
jgi:UDP-N-acetylmuramoylalanine--D-glutamate ligase